MTYFAKLDSNNIVEQIIVVNDDELKDNSGTSSENIGIAFCQKTVGALTNWKQTDTNMRGNIAGIGYTYMTGVQTLGVASTDIFIEQKPFPSWSIGINTAKWYPPDNPGHHPEGTRDSGKYYVWNESNYQADPSTAWVLITP